MVDAFGLLCVYIKQLTVSIVIFMESSDIDYNYDTHPGSVWGGGGGVNILQYLHALKYHTYFCNNSHSHTWHQIDYELT